MWDSWENNYAGKKHESAVLWGFSRSFNKKSVRNWGTETQPGVTLGLESAFGAMCTGTAFEFDDKYHDLILEKLRLREGPSFHLNEMEVVLPDGRHISAVTAVNDTKAETYIGSLPLQDRTRMVRIAAGRDGRCLDYVIKIRNKLKELDVNDQAVEEFFQELWNK